MNTAELIEILMEPALAETVEQPHGELGSELLGRVLNLARENQPIIQTLPCGWELIDSSLGGLPRGEFLGLVGGPGVGKSMHADQLVVGVLEQNPAARALIFALETSPTIRMARLLAWAAVETDPATNAVTSCCPLTPILRGELREAGKVALQRGVERLEPLVSRVRFVSDVTEAGRMADLIEDEQPDVVLVDHLGLVVGGHDGDSEVSRFDACLGRLVESIRRANAAAILINELSKVALASGKIDMSASRGSARFASLAALFVGLARQPDREGQTGDDPSVVASLVKSRFGVAGIEQRARFMGGLAYFSWKGVERCESSNQKTTSGK